MAKKLFVTTRVLKTQDEKNALATASQIEALRRIIKSLRHRIHELEKPMPP